jgi:DNA-binding NarL/FixJ family response regulator
MTKKKSKIVIVEDHPMFRERLVQLIRGEPDLECCGEADSPGEATRIIRETAPDLVLVDLTLRGGSGLVLIKALRALGLELQFLVLSMHEEALYAERAVRSGANGYITKHRPSSEVLVAIRRVLSGEIYLSERITSELARSLSGSGKWGSRAVSSRLSEREVEVLRLIGRGHSTREIAEALSVGVASVDTYRARIKVKMNLRHGTELQHFAIQWLSDHE